MKQLSHLIRKDTENVPLPALQPLASRIKRMGKRYRLVETETILRQRPDNPIAVELFLEEFVLRALRQRGGSLCLGPVFVIAVHELPREVLKALPGHTCKALIRLAGMAKDEPVPISDPRWLAHALTVKGETVDWLLTDENSKAA